MIFHKNRSAGNAWYQKKQRFTAPVIYASASATLLQLKYTIPSVWLPVFFNPNIKSCPIRRLHGGRYILPRITMRKSSLPHVSMITAPLKKTVARRAELCRTTVEEVNLPKTKRPLEHYRRRRPRRPMVPKASRAKLAGSGTAATVAPNAAWYCEAKFVPAKRCRSAASRAAANGPLLV